MAQPNRINAVPKISSDAGSGTATIGRAPAPTICAEDATAAPPPPNTAEILMVSENRLPGARATFFVKVAEAFAASSVKLAEPSSVVVA